MQIEVLNVAQTTQPNSKGGTYGVLELAFKRLDGDKPGKVEGRKLVSFKYPNVFGVLAEAKPGEQFTINSVKEGDFWQWTAASKGLDKPAMSEAPMASAGVKSTPKSTYETPEERAKRQVYIIKQSSISNAVESLAPGAKAALDPQKVIETAQIYFDWVMGNNLPSEGLAEMQNDIPF